MYTVNNDSPPDFDLSHHTSLKRKKPAEIGDSVTGSPAMEKSHSVQADMMQQRPASMVVPCLLRDPILGLIDTLVSA
jgi:hypothetical protein